MFVLAPFASLTLRMQGYAVGPGRGLTRRRGNGLPAYCGGITLWMAWMMVAPVFLSVGVSPAVVPDWPWASVEGALIRLSFIHMVYRTTRPVWKRVFIRELSFTVFQCSP